MSPFTVAILINTAAAIAGIIGGLILASRVLRGR